MSTPESTPESISTPESTPGPTATPTSAPGRRGRWIAALVLTPVMLLMAGGCYVMYGWPEWYDKVPPPEMVERTAVHTQDAYRVLDLGPVLKPRSGPEDPRDHHDSNSASTGECYPDGLEAMEDEPLDGVYNVGHGWTVIRKDSTGVRAAFNRLADHLRAEGWDVEWGESINKRNFGVTARKDDYRLSIHWEADFKEVSGSGTSPCARFPSQSQERDYKPGDFGADSPRSLTPPTLVPGRKR
jgi:hypothetical protein